MSNYKIGVFDSGIGGLTVVREIAKELPDLDIVYFGDTARNPYGTKTKEEVLGYARQITKFLIGKGADVIVIACNTATAHSLKELKEENNIPVIGVIGPGASSAAHITKNGKVGIIATDGTIRSESYTNELKTLNSDIETLQQGCQSFVPLAESGKWVDSETEETVRKNLEVFENSGIDTLILGCTHFALLRTVISEVMGKNVTIVDPAKETARELKRVLTEKGLPEGGDESPKYEFYVSGDTQMPQKLTRLILPDIYSRYQKVDIDEF